MTETDRHSPLVPPRGWLREEGPELAPISPGFLMAATALAALLRLTALTGQSLWVDEVITWNLVRPGVGLTFLEQIRDNVQGPLHLAILWPLLRLADTELMLRLPSAVAGILAIPALGHVAAKLVPPRAARLAVLLLAINPFHLWYSQEARGYALVMLCAVGMVGFFLELVGESPTRRHAVGFALASAGAVWSNMSGIFLWVALLLSAPFFLPRGRRAGLLAAAFAGGLLAALPWLLQASGIWAVERIMPGAGTGEALRGETTFSLLAVPFTFYSFVFGSSLGPSLRDLHGPDRMAAVTTWWPLLTAAAGIVGTLVVGALVRGGRRAWLLSLWIAVPACLLAVLAFRNVKPWNPRYLAVALPWFLVLVAAGATGLPRRAGVGATVLLCVLTLVSLGGYYGFDRYAKADIRGARAWIAGRNPGLEAVVVPTVTGVYRYYDRGQTEVVHTFDHGTLHRADQADTLVAAKLAGYGAAWIVLVREWHLDPRGLLVPALERAGEMEAGPALAGVRIFHWCAVAGSDAP
ncbi:MAG: hypothetical protein GY838_06520 [bacterium]|nr:hypothetical protein [bacterium]